ncbi:MAG: DUF3667 domain-containing protein [Flavobacterium sp.]|nr:MAG: DUF3667 domain-containing protein [Flavobacterium sp.]
MNCTNCSTEINQNYCPKCGQAALIKRINGRYIIHEIEHILHFEKGILYTIRELSIRPGNNINHFIKENRSRLVKPIVFIIITSLIYSIISHFFHLEDGYVNFDISKESTSAIFLRWINDHYGYSNIIMGVFIAFWLKLFFKKYDYNFFEIIILLCFVMGMGMLIFAFFALIEGISHFKLMSVAGAVGIVYMSWAIGQFFEKKKLISYFKAFVAYCMGMVCFTITAILIGVTIDALIKH